MRYANSSSMTQRSATAPTTRRIASGNLWKSLILTISFFGTFLGSLVRVRNEQPPNEGTIAVEVRAPVKVAPDPVKAVVRAPEGRTPASVRSLPPMPEKPVFQKPVTRTRRS